MTWVKIDDGFADHPKIARVGPVGAWLQVQALCYANKNLTDGFVPTAVAHSFVARGAIRDDDQDRRWTLGEHCGHQGRDVGEVDWPELLVEARIWEHVPGGYYIHDYPEYQPTKAEVLADRAKTAARVREFRSRRNAVTNAGRNAVSNTSPVPVPVPVSPDVLSSPDVLPGVLLTPLARSGGGPGEPPRAAARSSPSRRKPFPDDFTLTEKRRTVAQHLGLDAPSEFGAFRDHHTAKGSLMANWDAAWRTWCRRSPDFHHAARR